MLKDDPTRRCGGGGGRARRRSKYVRYESKNDHFSAISKTFGPSTIEYFPPTKTEIIDGQE